MRCSSSSSRRMRAIICTSARYRCLARCRVVAIRRSGIFASGSRSAWPRCRAFASASRVHLPAADLLRGDHLNRPRAACADDARQRRPRPLDDMQGRHHDRAPSPMSHPPYGGAVVKWVAFMVAFLQGRLGAGCVVAAGGAVRASAGVATCGQPHMRGLWLPQDLVSSHVRCLRSSAAGGGPAAHWFAADWLCASAGRPGTPRQPQQFVGGSGTGYAMGLLLRRDGACLREGVARRHG